MKRCKIIEKLQGVVRPAGLTPMAAPRHICQLPLRQHLQSLGRES